MNPKKTKYHKMLRLQEAKEWDLETDIRWDSHRVASPLLPECDEIGFKYDMTGREKLVFSQFLGLMAVQAISQHERILADMQESCWRRPLLKINSNRDYIDLGEQFFKEEAKHSRAFAKYVEVFSSHQNIDLESLKSVLPEYKFSWLAKIFKLNSILGGRAIWWLVMITEEESLSLFRKIRDYKGSVDPLFYQLNELHFQEEIRHTSYAPLMLRELTNGRGRLLMKFDYILASTLHKIWIGSQIRRLKRISKLDKANPFFNTLQDVYKKFRVLSLRKKVFALRNEIPFLSELFNPLRHRAIAIELQRNPDHTLLFRRSYNV